MDAFTLLRELLDEVCFPAGFTPEWDPAADPILVAAARAEAGQRLRSAGLLIAADPPGPGGRDGGAALGSGRQVHPSLRAALDGLGRAGLQVEVRTWAGDRALLAHLGVGIDAGVGLARLQHVTSQPTDVAPAGGGPGDLGGSVDTVGVELAIFESGDALGAIERLLPPLPATTAGPAGPTGTAGTAGEPIGPLRLDRQSALAILALLRRRDTISTDQLPVAREVLRILLRSAALTQVPPLLDRLTGPLEAAIRITFTIAGRADGDEPLWIGYWLQCSGQLIGLRAEPTTGATAPESVPESGADVVLTLVPTDGASLRADLLLAVTDAFASSQPVEGT